MTRHGTFFLCSGQKSFQAPGQVTRADTSYHVQSAWRVKISMRCVLVGPPRLVVVLVGEDKEKCVCVCDTAEIKKAHTRNLGVAAWSDWRSGAWRVGAVAMGKEETSCRAAR